jgi:hypothetical protein
VRGYATGWTLVARRLPAVAKICIHIQFGRFKHAHCFMILKNKHNILLSFVFGSNDRMIINIFFVNRIDEEYALKNLTNLVLSQYIRKLQRTNVSGQLRLCFAYLLS